MKKNVLISIKPKYSKLIFNKTKTVELRKSFPLQEKIDDRVLVYESHPTRAIVGYFKLEKVFHGSIELIWSEFGKLTGTSRREFLDYFQGKKSGYALLINKVHKFDEPIPLSIFRTESKNFTPPQSYRYLPREKAIKIIDRSFISTYG